jgi:hypothetical protein
VDACITWGCAWKGTSFVGKDSAGRKMQTGAGCYSWVADSKTVALCLAVREALITALREGFH